MRMPVKRSIRMKQRPRTKVSKRAARTSWWTGKPAIAAAVICAVAVMFVMLLPHSPRTAKGASRADAAVARGDSTPTPPRAPEMATLPIAPPAPMPAAEPASDTKDTKEAKVARVTIEGCLERADDAYRLTDTAGTNAPTSRSWKSAFLKKRPATIEVRDEV